MPNDAGKGDKRRAGKNFEANFDKVFGAPKKVKGGSFVMRNGKAVPRETVAKQQSTAYVPKEFEPFKSTIDGSVVNDRAQLAQHNKRNGVTDARDYSGDYIQRRGQERVEKSEKALKQSRHNDVKHMVNTILRRG